MPQQTAAQIHSQGCQYGRVLDRRHCLHGRLGQYAAEKNPGLPDTGGAVWRRTGPNLCHLSAGCGLFFLRSGLRPSLQKNKPPSQRSSLVKIIATCYCNSLFNYLAKNIVHIDLYLIIYQVKQIIRKFIWWVKMLCWVIKTHMCQIQFLVARLTIHVFWSQII